MQTRGSLASNEEKNGIYIKPSFGVGAPLKIWEKQYMQMDYALDLGSVGEGLSHLFSFLGLIVWVHRISADIEEE